tara:strand:- start:229 stop:813 length:585 start_codon:yes stop_codon:yes gene_type:complete
MDPYKLTRILTDEQRHQLLDMYHAGEHKYATQDYNLHDCTKVHTTVEQQHSSVFKDLDAFAASHEGVGTAYSHYFLHYGRDGFTKSHSDNDDDVGLTIVTLLETTPVLKGGETIVTLPYDGPANDSGYVKGNRTNESNDTRCIFRVVPMEEGDSISYNRSLMHAVSQVEEGHRIVCVSWYRTDDPALLDKKSSE